MAAIPVPAEVPNAIVPFDAAKSQAKKGPPPALAPPLRTEPLRWERAAIDPESTAYVLKRIEKCVGHQILWLGEEAWRHLLDCHTCKNCLKDHENGKDASKKKREVPSGLLALTEHGEPPKRPPNAYMLYVRNNSKSIGDECGSHEIGAVRKRASELWKQMSEADKTVYEDMAAAARQAYETAKAEYDAALPEPTQVEVRTPVKKARPPPRAEHGLFAGAPRTKAAKGAEEDETAKPKPEVEVKTPGRAIKSPVKTPPPRSAARGAKAVKDAEAPKKPLSSYTIFVNEKRASIYEELGTKDIGAVAKHASELWKALSEADRIPYEEKATAAKQDYQKAKEAYKKSRDAHPPAPRIAVTPPLKASAGRVMAGVPAGKRQRRTTACSVGGGITAELLVEAGEYAAALQNLAARPEAQGRDARELLKVLQENDGLVNKAKAALCPST